MTWRIGSRCEPALTHGLMTLRVLAFLLPFLLLDATAYSASLTLAPVQGTRDSPAAGVLTLDPADDNRVPRAYRCAQTFPDLPLSAWMPIGRSIVTIRRVLPGFQSAASQHVICEIAYETGDPIVLSVLEDLSRRSGAPLLPTRF